MLLIVLLVAAIATATGFSTGCLACTINVADLTCTFCSSGYALVTNSDSVIACWNCATGKTGNPAIAVSSTGYSTSCSTCYGTAATPPVLTCTACRSGNILDSSVGACYNCATGFQSLSGATTFASGFVNGCISCVIMFENLQCIGCSSGYYGTVNCKLCNAATGVANCSSATVHLTCTPGYVLVSSTCTVCTSVTANCFTCSTASAITVATSAVCNTCATGYFLTSQGTCVSGIAADINCLNWNSTSVCTACATNYFQVATSGCIAVKNCQSYSSASVCTNCTTGYSLNSTNFCNTKNSKIIVSRFALLSIIFFFLF